ncbi:helix-turn-helix domain-containing protein, partial [Streptomyces sp. NTH33]
TCDGCERAFRAPEPGRCRDCRAWVSGPDVAVRAS